MAVVTSGCGEQLIQTTLAKRIGDVILRNGDPAFNLQKTMNDDFIHSNLLRSDIELSIDRMGGALAAYYDGESVDFNVAFTTESMAFGFMSSAQYTAKVRIARNESFPKTYAPNLTLEGFVVKLKK